MTDKANGVTLAHVLKYVMKLKQLKHIVLMHNKEVSK